MQPSDFVFEQVYKGAKAKGVSELIAHQTAVMSVDRYKKSAMRGLSVSKFIEAQIQHAKMLQGKTRAKVKL